MLAAALTASAIAAGFGAVGLLADRIGPVYGLASLFAAAWVGHAGDLRHSVLTGAIPAIVAVMAADAVRLTLPVVGLAPEDRGSAVELLGEDYPGELVRERHAA